MRSKLRRSSILLMLYLTVISAAAQTPSTDYSAYLPKVVPQTPQAAAFARYGEYPVSKSTGVPQIEIPLYEIKSGDITIPISLSYHASGIKVEDVATPAGLGWSLNTGGVITRSLYAGTDEPGYTNNHVRSVEHVSELMQNMDVDVRHTWKRWGLANDVDTQSDRYIYNFNGKSGVFRYNSLNNEIVTIPYSPIKIEVTTQGFRIKDTDGLIYYFEAKEFLTPNGNSHISAWYITKIESQLTGHVVEYKYKQGVSYYFELNKSHTKRRGIEYFFVPYGGYGMLMVEHGSPTTEGIDHSTTINYMTLLVDEITWNGNTIKFQYTSDRRDKYKDRLNSITVNSGSETIRTIVFNNNSYWGDNDKNYRMRLENVEIKGGTGNVSGEKYQFKYNTMNLPDYQRLSVNSDQTYCREDYWGYYNGNNTLNYFIPSEYAYLGGGADRNPNETYMQACILQEIEYPTGGNTLFEYEANRATGAYDYRTTMSVVGGLRIKRIRSRTDGAETIKTYEYSGSVNQMIRSDMYQYKQTRYYTFHCIGCGIGTPIRFSPVWEYSTSTPLYSITGWGDCPVFYDTVTEYIGTPQSNQGKKVSQYRKNHRSVQNLSSPPTDRFGQNLYRFWSPYYNYDQGLLVPLLTSEKDYEFTGNGYSLKKETVNEYLPVDMGQVTCGVRLSLRDDWIHGGVIDWGDHFAPYLAIYEFLFLNIEYYDIIGCRYFLLPSKTRTTEYTVSGNISTTISHAYDASYRSLSPVKTTTSGSDTATLEETVLYPFNMNTAPYTTMVQNNIMDAVIKKTRLYNNSSKSIQYNYRAEGLKFVQNNILTGNNSLETRITYHTYDFYGNPVYVSKDNAEQVVYLWSYNGQYLVAEIKGATYEQVKTALGGRLPESLSSEASPNMTLINGLRTALSAAMVTVYTYKSLVGVTSVTKPNGEKFTYEYDNFGRLVMIKDHDGKVVEQYGYNYKN